MKKTNDVLNKTSSANCPTIWRNYILFVVYTFRCWSVGLLSNAFHHVVWHHQSGLVVSYILSLFLLLTLVNINTCSLTTLFHTVFGHVHTFCYKSVIFMMVMDSEKLIWVWGCFYMFYYNCYWVFVMSCVVVFKAFCEVSISASNIFLVAG